VNRLSGFASQTALSQKVKMAWRTASGGDAMKPEKPACFQSSLRDGRFRWVSYPALKGYSHTWLIVLKCA